MAGALLLATTACDAGDTQGGPGLSQAPGVGLPTRNTGGPTDRGGLPSRDQAAPGTQICKTDLDCALPQEDLGQCRVSVCLITEGKCQIQDVLNGTLCDDLQTCSDGDACQAGVCVADGPLKCDDQNVCTQDACDDIAGCVHQALEGACNDDNPCTMADSCALGVCVGGDPVTCDDWDPCTTDGCDPLDGCKNIPHVGACDDGNACTAGDSCGTGQCVGQAVLCNDSIPCTDDICDSLVGCTYLPNHGACSPGDTCANAICEVGVGCVETPTGDGIPCDDQNPCTQLDLCTQGGCKGTPKVCPASGDPCLAPYCDMVFGCTTVPQPNLCNDGDGCTTNDTCQSGQCLGTQVPGCGGVGGGTPTGGGSCCATSTVPGCSNPSCQNAVCGVDSYCCLTSWDSLCVQCAQGGTGYAGVNCAGLAGACGCGGGGAVQPGSGFQDCCQTSLVPGCNILQTESCVCAQDSYCCNFAWDNLCVSGVSSYGCGACF